MLNTQNIYEKLVYVINPWKMLVPWLKYSVSLLVTDWKSHSICGYTYYTMDDIPLHINGYILLYSLVYKHFCSCVCVIY